MSLFGKLVRGATAAVSVALGSASATAQAPVYPPARLDFTGLTADPVTQAAGFGRGARQAPCAPCTPATPCPVTGQPMPQVMGDPSAQPPPPVVEQPVEVRPDFGIRGGLAGVAPDGGVQGYIENALPASMIRLRFDSAYNSNRPDRGNFFYAKSGILRQQGQSDAIGVPLIGRTLDYQELTATVEFAVAQRFSAFVDVPVRFLNPDTNPNASGLSDIGFGAKYAVVYNPNRVVSLFVRFLSPSGDISTGLGAGQWFVEPGLLYLEQLSPKWQTFGEFRFMAPLGVRTDFTGNLIRYGLGTSYRIVQGQNWYVAPVVEAVGWTVLSGKEFNPDAGIAVGAAGDTIVNAKVGVRIGFGCPAANSPYPTRNDLYVGYGRALTGEVWYKDLIRFEFRRFF